MDVWKTLIRIMFRNVEVPVDWGHEIVDILDSDKSGTISLSEIVITLRAMWIKMKKANKIAKV